MPDPTPSDTAREFAVAVVVENSRDAMDFYSRIFGGTPIEPLLTAPNGAVVHAEIQVAGGTLMLADASVAEGAPTRLSIVVDDVDAVMAAATAAGADIVIPVADQFYGHRSGRLRDPFGHEWIVSTVLEELSQEEMQTRMERLFSDG